MKDSYNESIQKDIEKEWENIYSTDPEGTRYTVPIKDSKTKNVNLSKGTYGGGP